MSAQKTITILGATGSIGQSAASVIAAQPERFDVRTVTAYRNAEKLAETAIRLGADRAVIVDEAYEKDLIQALSGAGHDGIEVLSGESALLDVAGQAVDVTLAAIVGVAGLPSIMKAIENSAAVAIANKEPLVAAGALVMEVARKHGTAVLPVDSEHNAIFQVFDFDRTEDIKRIILTASGGPFRDWSREKMRGATPEQALAHPNWSMGDKISVDSATMMNKALEVIEAHYLFGMPAEKIDVVVHPQSVVHSMVEYRDGSVLSQMGASDMRTPLANVLSWPERLETPGDTLSFERMTALTFMSPDFERFPALRCAYTALEKGAYACVAMNAANEVAVDAFLAKRIGFLDIVACVDYVLSGAESKTLSTIESIRLYDREVRLMADQYLSTIETKSAMVS